MVTDIVAPLLALLVSLLGAAAVVFIPVTRKLIYQILQLFGFEGREAEKPYSERLSELMTSLIKASREVDGVLAQLAEVTRNREVAVQNLETESAALETREKELKESIQALEKTPLPAAEHFAKLLESREKRSARRDYMLFGAGVMVATVIAIIAQVVAG
jgi:hypothetical protein